MGAGDGAGVPSPLSTGAGIGAWMGTGELAGVDDDAEEGDVVAGAGADAGDGDPALGSHPHKDAIKRGSKMH